MYAMRWGSPSEPAICAQVCMVMVVVLGPGCVLTMNEEGGIEQPLSRLVMLMSESEHRSNACPGGDSVAEGNRRMEMRHEN